MDVDFLVDRQFYINLSTRISENEGRRKLLRELKAPLSVRAEVIMYIICIIHIQLKG